MPISGPNAFGSLTWARNACARSFAVAAYSSLGTRNQEAVDDALAHAMDRIAQRGAHQWLRLEDGFSTTAGYATGTADVTLSSASVVGTGTLWIANLLIRDVFNIGEGGFYRLAATPTSNTALTLTSPYSEATATGATYQTFRDQIPLPVDFLRLIHVREIDAVRTLEILSRAEWAALTAGSFETGRPRFCFLAESDDSLTSTAQFLQLWPIPDAVYGYQVLYDAFPTWQSTGGNAVPGAPTAMRALLAGALAALFAHDPERGPMYEVQYLQHEQELRAGQDRTTRQKIRLKRTLGSGDADVWPLNYAPEVGTNNG